MVKVEYGIRAVEGVDIEVGMNFRGRSIFYHFPDILMELILFYYR